MVVQHVQLSSTIESSIHDFVKKYLKFKVKKPEVIRNEKLWRITGCEKSNPRSNFENGSESSILWRKRTALKATNRIESFADEATPVD